MSRTKKRIQSLVAATAVAAGLGFAAVAPASAGAAWSLHPGPDYSSATIWLSNGSIGRAYARHGNVAVLTGWSYSYARAYVDVGYTSNAYARVDYYL